MGYIIRDQQSLSKKGQKKQQKAEEKAKRKAETQARLVSEHDRMLLRKIEINCMNVLSVETVLALE